MNFSAAVSGSQAQAEEKDGEGQVAAGGQTPALDISACTMSSGKGPQTPLEYRVPSTGLFPYLCSISLFKPECRFSQQQAVGWWALFAPSHLVPS